MMYRTAGATSDPKNGTLPPSRSSGPTAVEDVAAASPNKLLRNKTYRTIYNLCIFVLDSVISIHPSAYLKMDISPARPLRLLESAIGLRAREPREHPRNWNWAKLETEKVTLGFGERNHFSV